MVVFFSVFFFVSHVRICMRAACCCAGSFPVWSGGRTEQGEINIAAELQTGIFCKVSWPEDNEGGKLDYPGRWTYSRDVIIDRKNECQIFSTFKTHTQKKNKSHSLKSKSLHSVHQTLNGETRKRVQTNGASIQSAPRPLLHVFSRTPPPFDILAFPPSFSSTKARHGQIKFQA